MLILDKEKYVYSFSKDHEPIAVCDSEAIVLFQTKDCYSDLVNTVDYDWDKFLIRVNPVNGPLYIKGATPNDTLLVEVLDIKLNNYGIIVSKPYNGVFGKEVSERATKIVQIEGDMIKFNDNIKLPIKPMIGCIGTAAIAGEIASNTPNNHGGNMDNTKIAVGSLVELPIFADGALLAMGDLHATMGDGEVNCSGIECGGSIKVKISLMKNRKITNPRVINKGVLYTTGSGIDLDMALKIACKEMSKVIMDANNCDIIEAGMLMSAVGNLEICQIVKPLVTARFAMDLKYLNYDIKEKDNGN